MRMHRLKEVGISPSTKANVWKQFILVPFFYCRLNFCRNCRRRRLVPIRLPSEWLVFARDIHRHAVLIICAIFVENKLRWPTRDKVNESHCSFAATMHSVTIAVFTYIYGFRQKLIRSWNKTHSRKRALRYRLCFAKNVKDTHEQRLRL